MPPKRKYVTSHDKRMKKKKNGRVNWISKRSSRQICNKGTTKLCWISKCSNVDDVNAEIFENVIVNENINLDNQSLVPESCVNVDVPTENDNVDEQDVSSNGDGENLNNLFDNDENYVT